MPAAQPVSPRSADDGEPEHPPRRVGSVAERTGKAVVDDGRWLPVLFGAFFVVALLATGPRVDHSNGVTYACPTALRQFTAIGYVTIRPDPGGGGGTDAVTGDAVEPSVPDYDPSNPALFNAPGVWSACRGANTRRLIEASAIAAAAAGGTWVLVRRRRREDLRGLPDGPTSG